MLRPRRNGHTGGSSCRAEKAIATNLADRIDSERANKWREVYGVNNGLPPRPELCLDIKKSTGARRLQARGRHGDNRRDH
jgi:hypothetical protein